MALAYLSIIGFILSIYFLQVKYKQKTKNYRAICDFSDTISCSKAAKSKYANLFILPNAFYGVIFFVLVYALNWIGWFAPIFYLSIVASLISLYLIFLLIKIKVFCPVCVGTYIVNFLIMYISYIRWTV